MKSVNAAVSTAIRSANDVTAVPRLTVEWNWNRYSPTISADNTPAEDTEGNDIERFPIESLYAANRPTAGILKARVGEARVSDPYMVNNGVTRVPRFYIGSENDVYKYWTSPYQTDGTGQMPLTSDSLTSCRPRVMYPGGVATNKIVVGFEDTWAQPNVYKVYITTDGTTWTLAMNTPAINSSGQGIIYWTGSAWSTTKPSDQTPTTTIKGIEVRVNSLKAGVGGSTTGFNSYCSVIEISARREHDLSDRFINVSDTFDVGEKSNIYPIGTVTTNGGQLTLWNGDGVFNSSNSSSPYYGLIDANALFTLEYVYTVAGTQYSVQQFKLYGDLFGGQLSDSATVNLQDFSKFFQEIKPNPAMYQDISVAEIVWRVCDSVGFVDYIIDDNNLATQHKIPIWWCDGEKTVWQIFDEIAKATQTAIYFDGFGKLRVKTRENAFNPAASPVWTLRGEDFGAELADIETIDQTDELATNKVTVNYQATEVDKVVNGQDVTQVLWQPEGTEALRACPLVKDATSTDTKIYIAPKDAMIWPFAGMMNIEGELIAYDGKEFNYYSGGTRQTVVVHSNDEYQKYNNITAFSSRHLNHFSGALIVTERGRWNSDARAHTINASGYSVRHIVNGTHANNANGFVQHKSESRVYMASGPKFKHTTDLLVATRGATTDSPFFQYGFKIRFEKDQRRDQKAGMVIFNQGGSNEDGYYIELCPSSQLKTTKDRAARNELLFYTKVSGNITKLGPNKGRGVALAIVEGVDYEVVVHYTLSGSNHVISIYVNGKAIGPITVSGANKNTPNGKFGLHLRGDSKVSYEYLYAIARAENAPDDDFSFLDRVRSGYQGEQWEREWVYRWRTQRRRVKKKWTKEKSRWNNYFFDEFGPIVHEVRQYTVKFDPKPAVSSRLYLGNDYSIVCPEYNANAFSATFYLANASRDTAIANGEDTLTYAGSTATVNPIMAVIGRSVRISDTATVVVQNDDQIRARGIVETEMDSPWIQTSEMANALGTWITNHWSKGADEQTVTIFGNPLLELCDVVAVQFAELNMTAASYLYYVTAINTSFDTGLSTTVTLRRVVV